MAQVKALQIINLVAVFLPVVISLIKLVEGFITGKGTGPQKKEQTMNILGTIWEGLSIEGPAHLDFTDSVDFEEFAPMLGLIIDSSVAVANSVGAFKSGD